MEKLYSMKGYVFTIPNYTPTSINPMAYVRSWEEAFKVLNELKKNNQISGYLFTLVERL